MKKLLCSFLSLLLLSNFLVVYADGSELSINVTENSEDNSLTVSVNETIAAKNPTAEINTTLSDPVVKYEDTTVDSTFSNGVVSFKVASAGNYLITERTLDDNETDPIDFRKNVTLQLKYKAKYASEGTDANTPTTAKIVDSSSTADLTINASDCDILYESTGTTATYSSSTFPTAVGTYKATWTIKDDNTDYIGSGSATFEVVDKDSVIEYSITYVLNDGTNDENNPSVYYSDSEDFDLADATRRGYAFKGWYTDSAFTSANYVETVTSDMGDITLYAKWIQLGDVNDSGNINIDDILLLVDYYLSKVSASSIDLKSAELTGDGQINAADIIRIVDVYLGAYSYN